MALMPPTGPRMAVAAAVVAVAALGIRFAAAPGADLDAATQEMLGRAPRLDAYWYTRAAIDGARGLSPVGVSGVFDRPLYTWYCRAVFSVIGTSERALAVPSIVASVLGVAVLVLVGRRGGLGGAALLAGVFAATDWIAVVHDREPLVYSTVNLALLLSLLAWMRGLRRPLWFAVGWAGLVATAAWGKETVLLVAPALLATHLLLPGPSPARRVRAAAVAVAAAAVVTLVAFLVSPDALVAFAHKLASRAAFTQVPFPGGWVTLLGDLPQTLAVIGRIPALAMLAAIGVAAVLLEGPGAAGDHERTFRRLLVLWLVLGCLIVAGFAYRPTRYVLGLFPPAFLLAAHGARVLWGAVAFPARAGRATRLAALGAVWWIGLAALASWLLALVPEPLRQRLPALVWLPAVRLGIAAAAASLIASLQAPRVAEQGRIAPARRYAVALVAFVLLTDARGLWAHLRPLRHDDAAARRTFEAVIAPGARVAGYAAHYLAFDARYRVAQDFAVAPAAIGANPTASTHLATLWVPELAYVERLLADAGSPLRTVTDVVVGRERYRIYRLPTAEASGYRPTGFERARALEDEGRLAEAASAYRALVAAGSDDPIVLAHAGRALAGAFGREGIALLERARAAAPRNGLVYLLYADAVAAAGRESDAATLTASGASLLPHELVLGYGRQPVRQR